MFPASRTAARGTGCCGVDFGARWLAILAQAPPSSELQIHGLLPDGFAVHMHRTPAVSRFYLQIPPGADAGAWDGEAIWAQLETRLAAGGQSLVRGPIIDTSILELHSYVTEAMQAGRLFLAGDAAHIVSPASAAAAASRPWAAAPRRYQSLRGPGGRCRTSPTPAVMTASVGVKAVPWAAICGSRAGLSAYRYVCRARYGRRCRDGRTPLCRGHPRASRTSPAPVPSIGSRSEPIEGTGALHVDSYLCLHVGLYADTGRGTCHTPASRPRPRLPPRRPLRMHGDPPAGGVDRRDDRGQHTGRERFVAGTPVANELGPPGAGG